MTPDEVRQAELFREELVRREAVQISQAETVTTRCALLVTSASIATGLFGSRSGGLIFPAVIAGCLAALFGALPLLQSNVQTVSLVFIEKNIPMRTYGKLVARINIALLRAYKVRYKRNKLRSRLMRIGFAFLILELALIGVSVAGH